MTSGVDSSGPPRLSPAAAGEGTAASSATPTSTPTQAARALLIATLLHSGWAKVLLLQAQLPDVDLAALGQLVDPDEVVAKASVGGVELEALILRDIVNGGAHLGPAADAAGHGVGRIDGRLEVRLRGDQVELARRDLGLGVDVEAYAPLVRSREATLVGLGVPRGRAVAVDRELRLSCGLLAVALGVVVLRRFAGQVHHAEARRPRRDRAAGTLLGAAGREVCDRGPDEGEHQHAQKQRSVGMAQPPGGEVRGVAGQVAQDRGGLASRLAAA